MNKISILEKYSKEYKILVSKFFDKIEMSNKNSMCVCTDFLDMHQKKIIRTIIQNLNGLKNFNLKYIFYGGYDEAERERCFIYPDFYEECIYDNDIVVLEIKLPKGLQGAYEHRNYLGAIMKLGVKRDKIGDILVNENGADILVDINIADFLKNNLLELTRFSKSKIRIKQLKELIIVESKKEELEIIVQSLRLDCFVTELAKTSRSIAKKIIEEGKVFINQEQEEKIDRILKKGDIITIRGKGKFIFDDVSGTTKKNRSVIKILKYI